MRIVNRDKKNRALTTILETAGERVVRNEHGIALVLALVMLVLLSILGAFALSTSSSDLFIAGNYRNAQDALYSGDGAREWVEIYPDIYNFIVPNTRNIWPDGADPVVPATWSAVPVGSTTARAMVQWIGFGPLPPNMATEQNIGAAGQGSSFQAAYYVIKTVGYGRANTGSEIALESETLKIVPK